MRISSRKTSVIGLSPHPLQAPGSIHTAFYGNSAGVRLPDQVAPNSSKQVVFQFLISPWAGALQVKAANQEGAGLTGLLQILPEDSAGSPFGSVLSGERQGENSPGFCDTEEVEEVTVGASFSLCPSPPALKELTQSSGGELG